MVQGPRVLLASPPADIKFANFLSRVRMPPCALKQFLINFPSSADRRTRVRKSRIRFPAWKRRWRCARNTSGSVSGESLGNSNLKTYGKDTATVRAVSPPSHVSSRVHPRHLT